MSNEQNHNMEKEMKEPMTKHQFYFDTPLYDVIATSEIEKNFMDGTVDGYNHISGFDTTYEIYESNIGNSDNDYRGFYRVTLTCKRNGSDKLRFFILLGKDWVMKVGQWPSLVDIQFEELGKRYKNVFREKPLAEFKKAIELAAHGTGIGSFVYLRRIFENLISDVFSEHEAVININADDFEKKWMKDKIDLLKDYLPSQLLEMKPVYSILSKGIHQLSEQECLTYFEPLKLSIVLILDQKIEMDLKRQRDEKVKQEIQNIHTKLGKK